MNLTDDDARRIALAVMANEQLKRRPPDINLSNFARDMAHTRDPASVLRLKYDLDAKLQPLISAAAVGLRIDLEVFSSQEQW